MQQELTFQIVIDAQEIKVCYRPNYVGGIAHFEFRSTYSPPRVIPMSETGYRSHFLPMDIIDTNCTIEEFALNLGLAIIGAKLKSDEPDDQQLPLF